MQIRSVFFRRLANNVLEMGNEVYNQQSAASHYYDAGEFEKAGSLYFNHLSRNLTLEDLSYKNALYDYLKALDALPTITKMKCLCRDALVIQNKNVHLFLVFLSVILLSNSKTDVNQDCERLKEEFVNLKEKSDDVSLLMQISIIEAFLNADQGNWSGSFESLKQASGYKWSFYPFLRELYETIRYKTLTFDTPKWYLIFCGYEINTEYYPIPRYESRVVLIYERWGESGVIDYMNFVAGLSSELIRYAPRYKILTDVMDLVVSRKLKSFILKNLKLILGYANDKEFWTAANNLETLSLRYYNDWDFLKLLLEKAILLRDVFPEIIETIASQAKMCGLILDSKEQSLDALWFFEVAVRIGQTLSDKTIANTSSTYLVHHYLNYYQKSGYKPHITKILDILKDNQEVCAYLLAIIIRRNHNQDWDEDRDYFIKQYEMISHQSFLAKGIVYSVKSALARDKGQIEKAIVFLYKSAESYHNAGSYKEAGEYWLSAGSLSWQHGILGEMKRLFEKALSSFKEADDPWRQVTTHAALNQWADILGVVKQRNAELAIEIKEFEYLFEDSTSVRQAQFQRRDKRDLVFEKHVVELVISCCEGIILWEHGNYLGVLDKLRPIQNQIEKVRILESHPSSGFVFDLKVVVGCYISLSQSFISRRKNDFKEALEVLGNLVINLEHQQGIAAPIHRPFIKILSSVVKAQVQLTIALNPGASNTERLEAATCAKIDLETLMKTLENLDMAEEVSKLERMLTDFPPLLLKSENYDLHLAIPIIPQTEFQVDNVPKGYTKEQSITKIIKILYESKVSMEQSMKSFSTMDEYQLRDIILALLKSHFKYATGETFSRQGKTDILIPISQDDRLIIECKIWDGSSKYKGAITQLFKYLTQRENQAIILMFCTRSSLSSILKKTEIFMQTEKSFISGTWIQHESNQFHTSSMHIHPSDQQHEIKIHHLFIDLITLK